MYQNKRAWTYDVKQLGFRYHMPNLHGAIGLAQIRKMPKISQTRVNTCIFYNHELASVKGIITPKTNWEGITPFLYYIRVLDGKREEMINFLRENGVDTGIHWQPAHWFALFHDAKKGDLSVTEKIGKEILSLPLHSFMDIEDSQKIVELIKKFFE